MRDLIPLNPILAAYVCEDEDFAPKEKRGRKPLGERAMTQQEHRQKNRAKKKNERLENIAVLDFETDPFPEDDEEERVILPFTACLHSTNFDPVIIWNEDPEAFVSEVIRAIEALPGNYIIYAHNGGKFDFMFLLHRLRGEVSFKGRGIMAAKIGNHEIRDSFHIIPEKLAAYQKDDFDYSLLLKHKRNKPKNKAKIIEYMKNDCVYLLDIVRAFLKEHGLKMSIGGAAMAALKNAGYSVAHMNDGLDAYMRHYYFGGRVECLQGKAVFKAPPGKTFKLYDVNSMYPAVMALYQHPISAVYTVTKTITDQTVFLEIECDNYGALVTRGDDGETTATREHGIFKTTIWEYQTALKYNLIDNVKIRYCVNFEHRSNFENFVVPLYEKRQLTKTKLSQLRDAGVKETAFEFTETKKDDIFYKLLLNNSYGRMAINPRRFREHYITDWNTRPPEQKFTCCKVKQETVDGVGICSECERDTGAGWGQRSKLENRSMNYEIWSRPAKRMNFLNVATAASITGAARAMLMEAIQNADFPIYCDTDSLICLELHNTDLHKTRLGAWDLEAEFTEVAIAGKKLYACKKTDGKTKVASKGTAGLKYEDIAALIDDEYISAIGLTKRNKGPTLNKSGAQKYITRRIRATAAEPNRRLLDRITANRGFKNVVNQ